MCTCFYLTEDFFTHSYENFWTQRKTQLLLKCIWGMGVLVFLVTTLLSEVVSITLDDMYKWAITVGNLVYILFALVSNSYLLTKLSGSRSNPYDIAPKTSALPGKSHREGFLKVSQLCFIQLHVFSL